MPEIGMLGLTRRELETCPWESDCGPAAKAPDEPPNPTGYAPPLDSTTNLAMTPARLPERVLKCSFAPVSD